MSRKPEKRHSFFKVLCSTDFTRLLRLPHVLMQKYGSLIFPENVKLRIESGRTWEVKVETMEDGLICFTKGWKKFAADVGLKFGEFLVFLFEIDCHQFNLDVLVYETSGCKKEFPASIINIQDSDDDDELMKYDQYCKIKNHNAPADVVNKTRSKARNHGVGTSMEKSSLLYFEIVLKLHHGSRLSFSKTFSTAAGLMGKETVELEYVGKHHYNYQCVALDVRERQGNRIDMASGWPEFRNANGLAVGKTYSFEFKPSTNVIQVKEVHRGVGTLLCLH